MTTADSGEIDPICHRPIEDVDRAETERLRRALLAVLAAIDTTKADWSNPHGMR